MRRFPLRTLLLMALALAAFVRLYYISHQQRAAPPPAGPDTPAGVDVTPVQAPACRTLDRTLEGVVRTPDDVSALGRARLQLDACPALPPRACELGAALDARSPLEAGATPTRELLGTLCQRCPADSNPCSGYVGRTLLTLIPGSRVNAPRLHWNLAHAGPGIPQACTELNRTLLAPAAQAPEPLPAEHRELLTTLAPLCVRAGQVAPALLHAAVVQGDVPALRALVTDMATGTPGAVLTPDRTVGAPGGEKAFDGQQATGVALTVNEQEPRWRKDGALSALFDPPAREVTALRVRASGPGSLRAVVRIDGELGLNDPDTKTHFLLAVACRFRGTGQWEDCPLPVSLLSVEALSAFPDTGTLTLHEVEARGTR